MRRIHDSSPREVWEHRVGVVGRNIPPLRDRRRFERERTQLTQAVVHPEVNGPNNRHRAKESVGSSAREHVAREEPQAADRSKEAVASILTDCGSASVVVREVEQLRTTVVRTASEGGAPTAIDGGWGARLEPHVVFQHQNEVLRPRRDGLPSLDM